MSAMNFLVRVLATSLVLISSLRAAERARVLPDVHSLPSALSSDFEFRKTKLYLLNSATAANNAKGRSAGVGRLSKSSGAGPDPSLTFERQYRLFGAVTAFDQRQRFGNYFDFFWRATRPANLTMRLEYRQEKLRAFVQAREIAYPKARGNHKTEFAVIGDDFLDHGRVIAWRCLLVEEGRIVAQERSYLWE